MFTYKDNIYKTDHGVSGHDVRVGQSREESQRHQDYRPGRRTDRHTKANQPPRRHRLSNKLQKKSFTAQWEAPPPRSLHCILFFSLLSIRNFVQWLLFSYSLSLSHPFSRSDGNKDVQVEAVVRLPEEEDEEQAEEAGPRQTPVHPGQIWTGDRERDRERERETERHTERRCESVFLVLSV